MATNNEPIVVVVNGCDEGAGFAAWRTHAYHKKKNVCDGQEWRFDVRAASSRGLEQGIKPNEMIMKEK